MLTEPLDQKLDPSCSFLRAGWSYTAPVKKQTDKSGQQPSGEENKGEQRKRVHRPPRVSRPFATMVLSLGVSLLRRGVSIRVFVFELGAKCPLFPQDPLFRDRIPPYDMLALLSLSCLYSEEDSWFRQWHEHFVLLARGLPPKLPEQWSQSWTFSIAG